MSKLYSDTRKPCWSMVQIMELKFSKYVLLQLGHWSPINLAELLQIHRAYPSFVSISY